MAAAVQRAAGFGLALGSSADGLDRPGGPVTPGGADAYEQAGPVRWGQYVLTGTWDGAAVRSEPRSAALNGAPSAEPVTRR